MKKRVLALLLAVAMVLSLVPAVFAEPAETVDDPLSFSDAQKTSLTVKVDGKDLKVDQYVDSYLANPNKPDDQLINVYIPENADELSPVLFLVNNGGWQSDSYKDCTKITDGASYTSTSNSDKIGRALSEGFLVVSYGCRSRKNGEVEGEYIGHSPATMTDTKAAIRYLRYNDALIGAGDMDRIVITGTSGGGALSTVIAASGNSSDYFESLYEVGAAGITKSEDGKYVSDPKIGDDVFAVIGYCPITDFGHACSAYEWLFGDARKTLLAEYAENPNDPIIARAVASYAYKEQPVAGIEDYTTTASAELAALYPDYINGLKLKDENGELITADNFRAHIASLMEKEIAESINEIGIEQMEKDLVSDVMSGGFGQSQEKIGTRENNGWIEFTKDADGKYTGKFTYDFAKHVEYLATYTALKTPSAFSNYGMKGVEPMMNEDNLFGSATDVYSPFNEFSWNNDTTENHVGKDDTGMDWDAFMATDDGARLQKQIRMTSAVDYLVEPGDAEAAPHWYVRHGMDDRDTSFAVEATLYYAMLNREGIEDVNFEFAWLRPHSGDYDVQEAYNWLDTVLAENYKGEDFFALDNRTNITNATLDITLDGEPLTVERYWGHYYNTKEPNQQFVGPGMYGSAGLRDDLQINIYVPETATKDSAVLFILNNSSWGHDEFPTDTIVSGNDYSTAGQDQVALALARNMVVVSYGARCRGSVAVDNSKEYVGHSPMTVVDTKAAIRFLKHNIEAGFVPADENKIFCTGHSGGGALGSIIAATGNSSDYTPYLTNAAPAEGGDNIFGVLASAPITDLAYADFGYEWSFGDVRDKAPYAVEGVDSTGFVLSYAKPDADLMGLSTDLAARYSEYVNSMFGYTDEQFEKAVTDIMMDSIQHELDLDPEFQYSDIRPETANRDYFTVENGKVTSFDLDAYKEWVINHAGSNDYQGNELKGVMAFNSEGMLKGYSRNENNLWGGKDQSYSIAYEELWNRVADKSAIGVDKYDSFDAFWAAEGATVGMQMKMVSVMPYLMGSEHMWYLEGMDKAGDDVDVAPNWFIRHGMCDIDTSFAVVTSLILGVKNAVGEDGNVNAYFGWERVHKKGGSTYNQEFFAWVDEILGNTPDEPEVDPLSIEDVTPTTVTVTVDGKALNVSCYTDSYLAKPNRPDDQLINIYIPENADENSPIIFLVNNSGWQADSYKDCTKINDGASYTSTSNSDKIGRALSEGYVIVSYGARSRGDKLTGDEYLGHSPATMTDTKAAIRYLRYNDALIPAGDMDHIVITGTSGGGALSTVIAASGNSPDYFESLYEVGAAGITKSEDGKYVSDPKIGDDVFAVIAYCPITDLGHACSAYEWMFADAREALLAKYAENPDDAMIARAVANYNKDIDYTNRANAELAAQFVEYFNGLGLKNLEGGDLTIENLKAAITVLMEDEIYLTINAEDENGVVDVQKNIEGMIAEIEKDVTEGRGEDAKVIGQRENNGWIEFAKDANGNYTGEFTYDFDKHVEYLATYTALKAASAFSNVGMQGVARQNEDNLFGSATDEYSPFNEFSWNNDNTKNNVGLDDTGMDWDAFMATPDGARLANQIRMTSAVDYINDPQGAQIAPNWYVRHGMDDRDTSFAVEATLFYSLFTNMLYSNDSAIETINAGFAWLRPHSGNYDVQEAYAWLDSVLNPSEPVSVNATVNVINGTGEPAGAAYVGVPFVCTVKANDGYELPETVRVSVGGQALAADAYTYDRANGTVTIDADHVTGDIVVTVECVLKNSGSTGGGNIGGSAGAGGKEDGKPEGGETDIPSGGDVQRFTDVPASHWAFSAIETVADNGWFNGVGNGYFNPNDKTTRAQLVTVLYRMSGEPTVTFEDIFSDIPANEWYSAAVIWGNASGVVTGVSDTEFAPMNNVTREQIATMLWRMQGSPASELELSFADAGSVSDWARDAMRWAVEAGLFQGDNNGTLRPADNASRAEIATIIFRYANSFLSK